jgi:hypothetical protein
MNQIWKYLIFILKIMLRLNSRRLNGNNWILILKKLIKILILIIKILNINSIKKYKPKGQPIQLLNIFLLVKHLIGKLYCNSININGKDKRKVHKEKKIEKDI